MWLALQDKVLVSRRSSSFSLSDRPTSDAFLPPRRSSFVSPPSSRSLSVSTKPSVPILRSSMERLFPPSIGSRESLSWSPSRLLFSSELPTMFVLYLPLHRLFWSYLTFPFPFRQQWQKEKQFQKLNAKKDDRGVKVIRSGAEQIISVYVRFLPSYPCRKKRR